MPPRKDYHVYITRSTYHHACARQTVVNWKIKEKEGKEKQEEDKRKRNGKEEEEIKKKHHYLL